jgi:hypothetical protein
MIGVDYDLFWTLNPKSLKPFVKAFDLKTQYDDRVAWQSGLYIRMAVASVISKQAKYPSSPLLVTHKVNRTPEDIQRDIKEKMLRQMKIINSRFGKEE